jgi:hypothetical protein
MNSQNIVARKKDILASVAPSRKSDRERFQKQILEVVESVHQKIKAASAA